MIIIPAIDLKDGQCVRLRKGIMEDTTVFSNNPTEMASKWVAEGARRLHLVDLNGAFEGKPINADCVNEITKSFPNLPVQIGGGIRDLQTANAYIEAGISYLIIGTMAVTNPDFVEKLCDEFPNKIIVGLDANNGLVATDGWAKQTDIDVVELSKKYEQYGVNSIVYTDIARDGMMQGVNVEATANLAKKTS
ncbi:MAG: 1-(5-phosphoribosyl)-5-[(5-phosphoribosylamino)methylideneamino] imidazole-4-carboxamide isomerase, partial [Candidatus Thioglobus sp.]|nr:1-(5-phosphoribosyl)-5-[(5-phosphoribosylamino)methylideneamino] imidazole-4-carboxamide isomerase [Candidatus Thioglobus sp.]